MDGSKANFTSIINWNETNKSFEDNICIHHKFEQQVDLNPDNAAIKWEGGVLTFKQFNQHANKLAHFLIEKGAKPETLVAVCMDRSPEMMIGIYAILKSGAAYMPIDPNAPTERLNIILDDGKPLLVLTSKKSSLNLPEAIEKVNLDDILSDPFKPNETNPVTGVTSKNLAYIIYTSGSTGVPKGVMIEHHSVLNRIGWMQKAYPIAKSDVLIQKTPVTFDVSVWELFWWGFEGAELFLLQSGAEKEPEKIVQAIKENSVSVIHFVPSMFGAFINYLDSFKAQGNIFSLKKVFLSGEALPPSMVNEFNVLMKEAPYNEVINLYGPTEATVDVSHYVCPKNFLDVMYIGKPIDNTKLLVINEKNEILPVDEPGELVIAGVNLARGYLNREELNREKFIEITYLDGKLIRVYKTGDLVKWTESGNIFYIGRIDNQVKIRGFRIELGDIEAQIALHENVNLCSVVVNRSNVSNPQLVAYICLKPGTNASSNDIKEYLLKKLPEYMVPSLVVFLKEMPLTSSGKIDRKALPEPEIYKKEVVSNLIYTSNNMEEILTKVWKAILKLENIHSSSNFFDIGGNSILIPFIVNRLNKEYGIKIKSIDLIQYPTIQALANNILSTQNSNQASGNELIRNSNQKIREIEAIFIKVWKEILKVENISSTSNFFDLGGNSILIPFIVNSIHKNYGFKLSNVDIIQYPTIGALAEYLVNKNQTLVTISQNQSFTKTKEESGSKYDIAVIGMACKFPGAKNIDEFWENLLSGKNTIKHFTDEEVAGNEIDFKNLKGNPDYVKAKGVLNDIDKFDASFFGMTPKEAALTDPQHRVWLETVWEAFENAGCDPFSYKGSIGVFAGGYISTYLLNNVLRDPRVLENYIRLRSTESYQILTANDPSFISTKTAYKFNLRGPAINVQTACSTSLVAIAQACQNLYNGESDVCIAGGVCVSVPQECGYLYQEGAIPSPDGYCRPFDSQAKGTVLSNGVGVVVLKRLEDAIRDGDNIYSVVKGWALNNDGSNKVSYTAPSVDGQAAAIVKAQEFARVNPEDISYIEAHGTGTQLGDPVEVTALTKAFNRRTDKKQYCGIGSVKSNIGHTDAAAGVASFIKVSLSAFHKKIPASLNYSSPNPHIDFAGSPFYVQNELKVWNEKKPLIMGVSSFGIGGTNSHIIVEEPPFQKAPEAPASKWPELLLVSARSEYSLKQRKNDLLTFLKENSDCKLHNAAYTLWKGRAHMPSRSFFVASSSEDFASGNYISNDGKINEKLSKVVFMFPGQGAQYVTMGQSLYNTNEQFRRILDEGFEIISTETKTDLKSIIFDSGNKELAEKRLANTEMTQPALFLIEYALSQVLFQLGVKPEGLIGHSIGEYAAACIAGVFDMPTALKIVIKRGQLMSSMPEGKMLAVRAGVEKLESLNCPLFEIAGDNAPEMCSISLREANFEKVKELLDQNKIQYLPLNTSHAFHSSDFDPILKEFSNYISSFNLESPRIPFISCLTGDYITSDDAKSPSYWAKQLRRTVQFRKGINAVSRGEDVLIVEVGPNTHLSSLVKQNSTQENKKIVVTSLGKPDNLDEHYKIIAVLGNLYINGVSINSEVLFKGDKPRKIVLPTYPFEKKRYWIEHKISETEEEKLPQLNGIEYTTEGTKRVGEALDIFEKEISNIWKSILGHEEIGVNDDFFELGGHSLLALQINNRIKEAFQVDISLKEFLENPTIGKVGEILRSRSKVKIESIERENDLVKLVHTTELINLPLTSNQKRLWLISKLDPDIPSYIISDSFKFEGALDRHIFQESLDKLFQRHHIVFSVIKEVNGEPLCDIVPTKVDIEFHDLSDLQADVKIKKVNELIEADSKKAYNLHAGPLFRLYLMQTNTHEYYFHFSIHHIIFDGWSWSVFANDLSEIYNSLIGGKEENLKKVEFQEYDYALWEKSLDGLKYEEKSVKFWKEYLKDSSTVLSFPFDYQRKENQSGRGSYENVNLTPEISDKLRLISRKEGASLFTTLFSIFGIQLHKYTGEDDINIGLPVAYRPHSKLENIFGMFVNTIVVRLKCEKDQTFKDIIHKTTHSVLNAIDHQDLAFNKIVEVVNPERSPNINPLFQVAFAWQNNLDEPLRLNGIISNKLDTKDRTTEFDLSLSLWEKGSAIEGIFEYNTDLLKPETVSRLRDNFVALVEKLIENYDCAIENIPMITESEIKKINEFNKTWTNYPRNKTIVELFEEQVKFYPDKSAIVFKEKSLTYRQLNEKANQLARALRQLGVSANCPVGIFVDKSLDMIVGIFGILKAGGAYVPIDPEYPEQRINFVIKDSGCKVIITQDKFFHMPFEGISKLNLNSKDSYNSDKSNVEVINTSTDLAYIIYTSGTTGTPKGTLIPQQGVVRLIRDTNYIEFTPDDHVLQTSSIVFDASTEEIFGALLNGSTLYIIDKETLLDANAFGEVLSKNNITIVDISTALFTQIAEVRTDIFSKLKTLVLGGDVASATHVNKVKKNNPQLLLVNSYGPTENSCNSTAYIVDREYDYNIPIGKPISNSTAYIFNRNMQYQPIGVIGELYVGGDGLSKGYLNREELNKTSFIYNPYNPAERLYKTGDRARWLPDGNIEFFGRIDNQLKIRGYRVELEEIESVISEIDGVIETVVKPIKVEEGDYKLVAFLNVQESFKIDSKEIGRIIKSKLPPYMVPSTFKLMRGFKKNINGKIDRKALIADVNELNHSERKQTEPLTKTEKLLIDIWSELLKTKDILSTDNFFEIGGNSLLTISLASRIENTFGIDFNIRNFFSSPRIKDIAEIVDIKINLKMISTTQLSASIKIIEGEL